MHCHQRKNIRAKRRKKHYCGKDKNTLKKINQQPRGKSRGNLLCVLCISSHDLKYIIHFIKCFWERWGLKTSSYSQRVSYKNTYRYFYMILGGVSELPSVSFVNKPSIRNRTFDTGIYSCRSLYTEVGPLQSVHKPTG